MISRRALLAAGAGAVIATTSPRPAAAATNLDTTARLYGPVAIVGDSLEAQGRPNLIVALATHNIGPFILDVKSGRAINKPSARRFDTGRERVQRIVSKGSPGRWLFSLAGNDFDRYQRGATTPYDEIVSLLELIPGERVGWFTVWRKDPKWWPICDQFNADLYRLASERPEFTAVEWAEMLKLHPEWFRDGVHLRGEGIVTRQRVTAEAAVALC